MIKIRNNLTLLAKFIFFLDFTQSEKEKKKVNFFDCSNGFQTKLLKSESEMKNKNKKEKSEREKEKKKKNKCKFT